MYQQSAAHRTLNLIKGKWKLSVLMLIGREGPKRFGELLNCFPGVSHKSLAQQLSALTSDRLLIRTAYTCVPPKVVYTLSDRGMSLLEVIYEMERWGHQHDNT